MNPLIGKTITSIHLASDKKAIKFDLEGAESVVAKTDGDCCSSSYIEDLDTPKLIIGGSVTEVEDLDMPDVKTEEDKYGDVTARYGCKIKTTKGDCVIEYRNESNGYYGGNLVWPGDHFYGGVFGQNVSTEQWEKIAP